MSDWQLPWSGGCRCGDLRFTVTAPPLIASACHCTGCQAMTSSAFSLSLALPADGFALDAGTPVIGGLHGPSRHHFCARCLTWVFTLPAGMDGLVNLRATLLDDHAWFVPFIEFWTVEGLPWARTPAVHSFATEPDDADFEGLIAEYAAHGARPA